MRHFMIYFLRYKTIFTRLQVKWNELSDHQRILFGIHHSMEPNSDELRKKFESSPEKLLATLSDKKNYVVHIKVKKEHFNYRIICINWINDQFF